MTSKITIYKSLLIDEVLLETSTSEETLSKALFAIKKLHGEYVIVYVNDVLIVPDDWYIYRLEAFDDIRIIPDPAIGAIIGAALGAYLGVTALGVGFVGAFGLFQTSVILAAALKGAAIGYALGSVADSLLFPPDMPVLPTLGDDKADPSYGWTGPQVVTQPEGPVSVTYGQFLIGGTLIMQNIAQSSWYEAADEAQPELSPDNHAAVSTGHTEKFATTGWAGWNGATISATESSYLGSYSLETYQSDNTQKSGIDLSLPFTTVTGRKYKVSLAVRVCKVNGQYVSVLWTCGDGSNTIQGDGEHLGSAKAGWGSWRELTWTFTETHGGSDASIRIYVSASEAMEEYVTIYTQQVGYDNISIKEIYPPQNNYISMLINLGEGPIEGIMKADETGVCTSKNDVPYILINGQPLANFRDVSWDYRLGTWNQSVIDYFHETTTYYSENRQIIKGTPVTYTGTGAGIEAFEVQLTAPNLFKIDGSGNMQENTIIYQLEYRIVGAGSWTNDGEHTITGKSKTQIYAYVKKNNLASGQYEIKITRIAPEYTGLKESGDLYLQGITEIVYENIAYRNSALLALQIKATSQLSGTTPNVTTLIRGKTVLVPDLQIGGVTQTYDDCYWDNSAGVYKRISDDATCTDTGNFVQQWTRSPIWNTRDFITNTRYGLGEYIEDADWDNATAIIEARYCWQLVTNFAGGTEHRFEMDLPMSRFMAAPSAIKLLSHCFRGNIIWSNGKYKPVIDRTRIPVQLFNESNITPGSLKTVYLKASQIPNFVEVQYADPNRNYDVNAIEVVDEDEWTSVKPLRRDTVNAKGTTRASEILRTGRYYLNCGKGVTKIHEFDCDLDAVHCEPGDVVQVQNDLIGWGVGGRIISATNSSVTTNIDVVYTADYTIRARLSNGDLEVKTVTSISNNNRTLNISGTFASIPLADSVFAYGATDVESKPFKVKTMTLIDNNKCKLVLSEESANKYNDTTNVSLPDPIYTILPNPIDPPDNVTDLTLTEMTKETGFWISFNIPSKSLTFDHADVLMSLDSDSWQVYRANIRENANIEVKDVIPGQIYYVKVIAYNSFGIANLSPPVASITLILVPGTRPPDITGLQLDREGHDLPSERLIFYQKDARFKWNKVSNISGAGHIPAGQEALGAGETVAEINYTYLVEIWVSGSKVRTEKGLNDPRYIYTYEKNAEDNESASNALTIKVWACNESANLKSENSADLSVTNPAPTNPQNLTSAPFILGVSFSWNIATEVDFSHWSYKYKICTHNFDDGSWSASWIDTSSNQYSHRLNATEISTYGNDADIYFKIVAYDTFGSASSESSTHDQALSLPYGDVTPPDIPTGLSLSSSTMIDGDGHEIVILTADWDDNTETDLAYYEWAIKEDGGNYVFGIVGESKSEWRAVKADTKYYVKVRASDITGNWSGYCSAVDHTTTKDTTPPSAPTGLVAVGSFNSIWLTWTNPADSDFAYVEVWRSDTNDRSAASKIAELRTDWHEDTNLGYDVTKYYWIRALDYSKNESGWHPSGASAGISGTTIFVDEDDLGDECITAAKITTGELITLSAQIKDAIIVNAKISDLHATKINAGDIATARMQVNAAGAVNAGSVTIEPGKITISGATTLSDWRQGGDTTKIAGGYISANTISANKLSIGSRNVTFDGIAFSLNKDTNNVAWTSGTVSYTNDADSVTSANISSGNQTCSSGTYYFYWVKDATTISNTTTRGTAYGADNLVIASYVVATQHLIVTYAKTIIDGSDITANTITATQIAAATITANEISANTITAAQIAANTITASEINVSSFLPLPPDVYLVGYWPLDSTSGTVAVDASGIGKNDGGGTGKDGTLNGFPTSDTYGQCDFYNSADGWTGTNLTITNNANSITINATANDPQLIRTVSVVGGDHFIITVRIKRTAGSGWQGIAYYSTSGHGYSGSYYKSFSQPSNFAEYQTIEIDMRDLTVGGTDWTSNAITGIRLDFGITSADDFEIDFIKIGRNIWVDGVSGKCLEFDGINEYIDVPYNALLAPTSEISFGCWAHQDDWTSSLTESYLLSKTQTGGYRLGFNASGDAIAVLYRNSAYGSVTFDHTSLSSGWHLFFVTYNGRYLKLYVDGELEDTDDAGTNYPIQYSYHNSLIIGAEAGTAAVPTGNYYEDRIDEIRIYNIALTINEIKAVYLYPAGNGVTKISGGQITCDNLSAISADLGSITAGTITMPATGWIKGGQTAYATGTGFFLGYSGGAYKFSFGDATKYITWDGTDLTLNDGLINRHNLPLFAAGDILEVYSDAQVSSSGSTTPVKVKEIYIARKGTLRIKFSITGTLNISHAAIYRNGVQVGTTRNGTVAWVEHSQDISGWTPGDYVQIYAWHETAGFNTLVRRFRLYSDKSISNLVIT